MPVLTAYAPQPIHSAGWASTHPNAYFPSRTSRFGPVASSPSQLRTHTTTRQKRCKPQLEKMKRSMAMAASSQSSKLKNHLKKRSVAIENPSQEVSPCAPVIKGILIKPSSLIHLYQSNPPVTESEIVLVAGSTSVRRPSVSTSYKPVVKKVRFSMSGRSRPQNSVLQRPFSTLESSSAPGLAANESDPIHHDTHLEPVAETIFFTHSRYSYDRSPIAVDKVLNKSLDLPPRTPIDSFSAGRWLPTSQPIDHCQVSHVPPHLALGNQAKRCVHPESTHDPNHRTLSETSPEMTPPPHFIIHSISLAAGRMEGVEWHGPESPPNRCDCEDCPNTSGPSFASAQSYPTVTRTNNGLYTHTKSLEDQNPDETCHDPLTCARDAELERITGEMSRQDASLGHDHLSCHSFRNLTIAENPDDPQDRVLQADDIFGIGNWTRAQVFGSCDALDGF